MKSLESSKKYWWIMYLIDEFNDSSFSEKIASLTAGVIVIGLFYKVGFYSWAPLHSAWIIQFFSVIDLAFSALKLLAIYIILLLTFNKILVINELNRNVWIMIPILAILCGVLLFVGLGWSLFLLAIVLGSFFSLLYFHDTKATTLVMIVAHLTLIPFLIGKSDIEKHLSNADLPKVYINVDNNKDWRLLDKTQDKVLLINMENQSEIKMVEVSEVVSFKSMVESQSK